MNFSDIFKRMVAEARLPYVILLHGPKGSGMGEAALLAAQTLLHTEEKVHVDLHRFFPEGKSGLHSIQAIRKLCHEIYLSSHAGGYKCFIIDHAERMLPASANALLKTFEEPPEKSIIFLLTTKPLLILPTIRSRCQSYAFQGKDHEMHSRFLEICSGILPFSELFVLCEALDEERKKEEQEEIKSLAKEMSSAQREMLSKEIEGRCTVLYQEKRDNLFETFLAFHRDLLFYHLGAKKEDLFFPELAERYKKLEPQDLNQLEVTLQKARLAQDRGVKLSYCLEECLTVY